MLTTKPITTLMEKASFSVLGRTLPKEMQKKLGNSFANKVIDKSN